MSNGQQRSGQHFGGAWKEAVARIRSAQAELARYGNEMSAYERRVVQTDLNELKERTYSDVYYGVASPYKAAIKALREAEANTGKAKAREIDRFDSARLSQEQQYATKRLEQILADPGNPMKPSSLAHRKVEAFYQEARQSKDIYKQRAIYEALSGLPAKYQGSHEESIHFIAGSAGRELQALRATPEIAEAEKAQQAAFESVMARREELRQVGELYEGNLSGPFAHGAFAKAYKQVQIDAGGNAEVFDEGAPELGGVVASPAAVGG
jgi:hypothetical protein